MKGEMKRSGLRIAAAMSMAAFMTAATAQDQEYIVRYAPEAALPDDPASLWSIVDFVELDKDDFTAAAYTTETRTPADDFCFFGTKKASS